MVMDLTSGNPQHTAQIGARVAEQGIHMIDAGERRCGRGRGGDAWVP
jgi:hypothetical protein